MRARAVALAATGLALAALAACGVSAPRAGQPAAALVPALAQLAPAHLPVYLPSRLPPPPPGDGGYAVDVHATAAGYEVSIYFAREPVAVNAPVATSRYGFVAEIWGGPAGSLPPMPRARFTGSRKPVMIAPGVPATLYPRQGITWSEAGWTYAVTNAFAATAGAVLPLARRIQGDLPPAGNPIGPGTHGEVIAPVGADAPDTWAAWTEGRNAYEIDGLAMPGDQVARALVRVSLPR